MADGSKVWNGKDPDYIRRRKEQRDKIWRIICDAVGDGPWGDVYFEGQDKEDRANLNKIIGVEEDDERYLESTNDE